MIVDKTTLLVRCTHFRPEYFYYVNRDGDDVMLIQAMYLLQ